MLPRGHATREPWTPVSEAFDCSTRLGAFSLGAEVGLVHLPGVAGHPGGPQRGEPAGGAGGATVSRAHTGEGRTGRGAWGALGWVHLADRGIFARRVNVVLFTGCLQQIQVNVASPKST